ncbi:hypothetical protein GWK47_038630 [Chionoecetes opilio]|uniref:Uncharacterized protein n=1 Tax=Chionoecetes opilio TaxID=41210 RepID=A0A8J5D0U4_CHIOP|nr:hypothetical protein GWK47_038630 [Chionoecetes opilio]
MGHFFALRLPPFALPVLTLPGLVISTTSSPPLGPVAATAPPGAGASGPLASSTPSAALAAATGKGDGGADRPASPTTSVAPPRPPYFDSFHRCSSPSLTHTLNIPRPPCCDIFHRCSSPSLLSFGHACFVTSNVKQPSSPGPVNHSSLVPWSSLYSFGRIPSQILCDHHLQLSHCKPLSLSVTFSRHSGHCACFSSPPHDMIRISLSRLISQPSCSQCTSHF